LCACVWREREIEGKRGGRKRREINRGIVESGV